MYRAKYVEKREEGGQENPQQQTQTTAGKDRERGYDARDGDRSNQPRNRDQEFKKPRYVEKGAERPVDRDNMSDNEEEQRDRRQGRQNAPRRNNYNRDERKIEYYTELPVVPEVRIKKPSEEDYVEAIKKIDERKDKLKGQRKEEKTTLKTLESGTSKKLKEVNQNIKLGEKAVAAFNSDVKRIDNDLRDLQDRIDDAEKQLSKIERESKKTKDVEVMTVRELDIHINKLENRIISENLDKKVTSELRSEIERCRRLKLTNKNTGDNKDTADDILRERQAKLAHLKVMKKNLKDTKHDNETKLRKTEEKLEELVEQKEQLEEEKVVAKNTPEYEKTQQMKAEIRQLRDKKAKETEKYYKALDDYEEQQRLVEYVEWATEVKKTKLAEKEKDKEFRKKQKTFQNKKDGKENQDEQKRFERPPPPHPYATEISNCNFLVQYLESIKPTESTPTEVAQEKKEVNIKEELTKGVWAKEKGVQPLISKKQREPDAPMEKKQRRVREKTQKEEESNEIIHTFQIQRMFEDLKITIPNSRETKVLDDSIAKLQEKRDYYVNTFSAGDSKPSQRDDDRGYHNDRRQDRDRKPAVKYEKKEERHDTKKSKLNFSNADFPTLP